MNTKKYYSRFFLLHKKAFRIYNKKNKIKLTPKQYNAAYVCLLMHQENKKITITSIKNFLHKAGQGEPDTDNLHRYLNHLCANGLLVKQRSDSSNINIYNITPLLLEVCDKMEEVFRLVRWDY